jgi:hypothetical protein
MCHRCPKHRTHPDLVARNERTRKRTKNTVIYCILYMSIISCMLMFVPDPDKERKKLKSRENSKGDKDKSVDSSKDKVERKNSGPNNNTISNNTNDELKKSSSGGSVDTRIKSGSVVQTSPSGPNNNIQPETVSILL